MIFPGSLQILSRLFSSVKQSVQMMEVCRRPYQRGTTLFASEVGSSSNVAASGNRNAPNAAAGASAPTGGGAVATGSGVSATAAMLAANFVVTSTHHQPVANGQMTFTFNNGINHIQPQTRPAPAEISLIQYPPPPAAAPAAPTGATAAYFPSYAQAAQAAHAAAAIAGASQAQLAARVQQSAVVAQQNRAAAAAAAAQQFAAAVAAQRPTDPFQSVYNLIEALSPVNGAFDLVRIFCRKIILSFISIFYVSTFFQRVCVFRLSFTPRAIKDWPDLQRSTLLPMAHPWSRSISRKRPSRLHRPCRFSNPTSQFPPIC